MAVMTSTAILIGAGVTAAASIYGAYAAGEEGDAMRALSKEQAEAALKARREQQKRVDKEVEKYRSLKFTNVYADIQTDYENVFEDLTVNQQQAQFQASQGAQQRADILAQFRSSAGGSGIASLAQAMANQGQLQTRQISASIGQQEAMNQRLLAQGAGQEQMMEYRAASQIAAGDAMVQEAESGRQSTILAAQLGQAAGTNANYQQALLNQQNANMQASQMQMQANMNLMKTFANLDYTGMSGGNMNYMSPADGTGGYTYDPNLPTGGNI